MVAWYKVAFMETFYACMQVQSVWRVNRWTADQKPDVLGKRKTILGDFFRKSLLNRPKSAKTDHITHTAAERSVLLL